jgi:hypothetical protein
MMHGISGPGKWEIFVVLALWMSGKMAKRTDDRDWHWIFQRIERHEIHCDSDTWKCRLGIECVWEIETSLY